MPDLPHDLTWVMLLGHWTALAKSALALPRDAQGDRWRQAIAPIITLQALCHALGELDDLDADERALGLDKSELLIQTNTGQLHELWRGEPLPELVIGLIDDARDAFTTARQGGVEWTLLDEVAILEHPAELMAALEDLGFSGDLYLPTPGVPVFASAPVGYARGPHGGSPDEEAITLITAFWRACSVGVIGPTSSVRSTASSTLPEAAPCVISSPTRTRPSRRASPCSFRSSSRASPNPWPYCPDLAS